MADPIIVEQPELVIEPAPTPPLPAETFSASGPHQLSSTLLGSARVHLDTAEGPDRKTIDQIRHGLDRKKYLRRASLRIKSRPLAARSYNRRLEENRVKDKPGEFLWD